MSRKCWTAGVSAAALGPRYDEKTVFPAKKLQMRIAKPSTAQAVSMWSELCRLTPKPCGKRDLASGMHSSHTSCWQRSQCQRQVPVTCGAFLQLKPDEHIQPS
jgi:hypothetical protein